MKLTAVIRKGEEQYVALCPELDVVSQGYTKDEALANLKEAVTLYVEEMGLPKEKPIIETFNLEIAKVA